MAAISPWLAKSAKERRLNSSFPWKTQPLCHQRWVTGTERQRNNALLLLILFVRPSGEDDLAADHCEQGFSPADLIDGDRHIVLGQDSKIREFADLERTAFILIMGEPGTADRVEAQRVCPRWCFFGTANRLTADGFAV